MLRARRWIIFGAALVALISLTLAALPMIVREWAERHIEAVTGRPARIVNIDLNLFTRRLRLEGFRLGGNGPAPARFDRLDGRFRLWPLLKGQLALEEVILVGPTIHLVRVGPSELNVSALIALLAAPRQGEPFPFTLDHFVLDAGRIIFEDRVVSPAATWEAIDVSLEARDLTTATGSAGGTAALRFALGGAPVEITADQLGLHPSHARALEELRRRRIEVVRQRLAEGAGVEPDRLQAPPPADAPIPDGPGQVQFALRAREN